MSGSMGNTPGRQRHAATAGEPDIETALTPYTTPNSLVRPLVTPEAMLAALREYEALKAAIIQPSDIQMISGRQHIKKSGWLRIARAFNLTVEPVSEQYITAEDGTWGYAIVVRAVAPNGASMQGDGMCWSTEKQDRQRTRHNVRAHAYTRASNRAISNLVGGGEVSAEELGDYEDTRTVESGNGNGGTSRAGSKGSTFTVTHELLKAKLDSKDITDEQWAALKRVKKNNLAALYAALDQYEDKPAATDPQVTFTEVEPENGHDSLRELPVGSRWN